MCFRMHRDQARGTREGWNVCCCVLTGLRNKQFYVLVITKNREGQVGSIREDWSPSYSCAGLRKERC
jgi:hypothetical protein